MLILTRSNCISTASGIVTLKTSEWSRPLILEECNKCIKKIKNFSIKLVKKTIIVLNIKKQSAFVGLFNKLNASIYNK